MALGSLHNKSSSAPTAEINVVPLVDVMLVLLVIFIITAPLLTHSIKIDLPKASNTPNTTQAEHIELAVKETGDLFWNGEEIGLNMLEARFAAASALQPQPELHIHADRLTHYENVAEVMSMAGKAGLTRIGFVTDPSETR
ncbi:MAG: biopolymer transporter ExbD [Gammaproteobacteria bacterium]|nr:biopolymer transporter ExbD [Gammaproteobacteria bacterium]